MDNLNELSNARFALYCASISSGNTIADDGYTSRAARFLRWLDANDIERNDRS